MRGKENLKKEIWYVLILLLAAYPVAAGKVIYVDDDAAGANNGSSWVNAYNYLQDALASASAGDEIRVAQGIYQPDLGGGNTVGDRRATFQLKSGVTIKGGYAGPSKSSGQALNGTDPNVVDIILYESTLSGDLNGDDVEVEGYEPYELLKIFDIPTRKDNSCYVVTGNNADETAVLNGFTITAGVCTPDDCKANPSVGAAIQIESGSPQILNCRVTDNYALNGAVLNNNSNSTFVGCIFSKNYASNVINISGNPVFTNCIFEQSGAGMYNRDGSSPMLTNCVFRENMQGMENLQAGKKVVINNCRFINDGGITFHSGDNSLTLVDCIFSNSGGIYCGFDGNLILNNCLFENGRGGVSARGGSLTLSNCVFSGNSGYYGAGIFSQYSDLVLYNCKFIGNQAITSGGGIYSSFGNIMLYNCTFSGNSADYGGGAIYSGNYSLVLQNCLLSDNSARYGASGIYAGGGTVMLYNCTLSGNTTEDWASGGIHYIGIRNNITLTNCILWGNTPNQIFGMASVGMASVSYSNIQGGFQGDGNIDVDPLFADPANGDYHLKSQAGRWDPNDGRWTIDDVTSPCIDTGDPRSAWFAEPEPNGGRINMGAYGGTPEASLSYITN